MVEQKPRRLSCPECGEPMLKIQSKDDDDEQDYFLCGCCGGEFYPQVEDPYAGLDDVINQDCHRGDRKGGSNRKGRFGNQKKPTQPDRARLHY